MTYQKNKLKKVSFISNSLSYSKEEIKGILSEVIYFNFYNPFDFSNNDYKYDCYYINYEDYENKVNQFEKEALDHQLKLNLNELNLININETKLLVEENENNIQEMKSLEFKLNNEITRLNSILFNDKIIKYQNIKLFDANSSE